MRRTALTTAILAATLQGCGVDAVQRFNSLADEAESFIVDARKLVAQIEQPTTTEIVDSQVGWGIWVKHNNQIIAKAEIYEGSYRTFGIPTNTNPTFQATYTGETRAETKSKTKISGKATLTYQNNKIDATFSNFSDRRPPVYFHNIATAQGEFNQDGLLGIFYGQHQGIVGTYHTEDLNGVYATTKED